MNWEVWIMSLYAAVSRPQVAAATVALSCGLWLQALLPHVQANVSASAALLNFAEECSLRTALVFPTQTLAFSLALACGLMANWAACRATGPLNAQEGSQLCKILSSENSCLQFIVVGLGQERTGMVELLLWGCIYSIYSILRGLLIWTELRIQANRRAGLEALIALQLGALLSLMIVTGWVFWAASGLTLVQLHYDGAVLLLLLAGIQMSGRTSWTAWEIKCVMAAHGVSFFQWSHFLLAHMKWLGFPLQFILFFRLTKVLQQLQQDFLRYRGFQQSTGLLLQQCPPLPASQVEALGDEKCCMCWEPLPSSTCSQLPCSHIHHIECLRKLMMSSRERKCPLCKQVFLQGYQPQPSQEFLRVLAQLTAPRGGVDFAVARIREVVPQISEEVVREELERTRSMQQTIANLVDRN